MRSLKNNGPLWQDFVLVGTAIFTFGFSWFKMGHYSAWNAPAPPPSMRAPASLGPIAREKSENAESIHVLCENNSFSLASGNQEQTTKASLAQLIITPCRGQKNLKVSADSVTDEILLLESKTKIVTPFLTLKDGKNSLRIEWQTAKTNKKFDFILTKKF